VSRGAPEQGDSADGASFSAVLVTDSLVVARTDAAEGPATPQRDSASDDAADGATLRRSEPTSVEAAGGKAAIEAAPAGPAAIGAGAGPRGEGGKVCLQRIVTRIHDVLGAWHYPSQSCESIAHVT
jgi:hypothetical protein